MTDWIKLVLPLVAVAMTSIIGFFLTGLVGELRTGRTIVYSLDRGANAVILRLANVSSSPITEEEFMLRCEDGAAFDAPQPPCFVLQPDATWYDHQSEGAVPVRRIVPARGNGPSQVGFELTLLPGARSVLAIRTGDGRAADVRVRWDPAPIGAQPLRLVEAGGIAGYIVLNYLQVLVWAFVAALAIVGLVVALGLLGILILFLRWLGTIGPVRRIFGLNQHPTAFSKFTMEVDNDALQATFTLAPADPARQPGPGR